MRRSLLLAPLLYALLAPPVQAAAVGFSLPQGLLLNADGQLAAGGSVSVLSTNANVSNVRVGIGLDYAYARQLANAGEYAFFDLTLGAGLPFAVGPQAYLMPAVDGHAIYFVTSPEGGLLPALGIAPRLTVGFHPAPNVSVEVSLSHAFFQTSTPGKPATRERIPFGLSGLKVGGTYAF